MKIDVIHGPNLNLLGQREPSVYGSGTLADLDAACQRWGRAVGAAVTCRQSNHEGILVDWLHEAASTGAHGIVLNAGAYTHTSIALRDAIAGIEVPVVEVHISNVHARESFRHVSHLAPVCAGTIVGLGWAGYRAAIEFLAQEGA